MKSPETKHCSCPDCRGSEMNECSQAAVERGNRAEREKLLAENRELLETRQYLEREIQDLGRQVAALTVGSEDRRPNLPPAPKIPVADWECGVCGWIGLAVPIMEVSHRHYEWNKAKGKGCSGIQSRQKHLAK